ncbi:tRNA (adenosine(37)-N6)-threonylcarbamoyltransferase complex dimerization subunit type 1 TsaB [Thiobacillus sp.]|uniref:tRNA (adenosine(37)-N6)-threonylcarbamoyltransferase complex dimerization subunit type 1 TsaB n=1 Tax=Thiobacillus sp. TaxID=924 RepID=UPI0025FA8983|nr:tRNA (adenosine(37)-N6)-threonylcarbamoyltransferase complex dimerization subunit type 1 TsaB [Thiobacillus sp.]MBT9540298.1 tRNA (adenosine(37)-N6)-threonylcarbamoyltransferase complex dimerization subunit type 1 TsaB [Thiobacillus sp.]
MKLLVIDTSTEWCSAALWLDGRILARRVLAEQQHSSLLLPMVDELLRESATSLRQLDGIGYGAGPGSFTGLRIACAVTQGLALGADLPVVGVSTLESIAEQTRSEQNSPEQVLAVLDARMAEVYWAAYRRSGTGWQCVTEPALALPESVSVPEGGDWMGAGNGFIALGAVLLPRLAAHLTRIDDTLMPDAAAMAGLAARAFERGEGMDAALAAPIYLRDKVALTIDERRAKRSA